MDRKFGQLFTGDDVERLLNQVVNDVFQRTSAEGELRRVEEAVNAARAKLEPKLPVDEPLFLLRGQDLYAPVAVDAYCEHLIRQGDVGMGNEVAEQVQAMREWQRANPSRVKLPD